jgi:hypothetical protein
MNPLVIKHIDCPVCHAPKGQPCTRANGCGMRLDDFMRDGPLEARLDLHIDDSIALPQHKDEPPLWVSQGEIEEAKASGLWGTVEARVRDRIAKEQE